MRPFWILILVASVAAAAGLYYAVSWPGFLPRSVAVGGNHIVSSHEIALRAAIAPHQNLWLQNMAAAADRVAAIPYVKSVRIYRSLPAQVRVLVTERAPYAVAHGSDGRVTVDGDLRVLGSGAGLGTELPEFSVRSPVMLRAGEFLKDPALRHLRRDYSALSAAHVAIGALGFDRFGDLTALTRAGIRLLLGDDSDLTQKTPLIGPILSQVAAGGRRLATVDLRAPKTPVVLYREK